MVVDYGGSYMRSNWLDTSLDNDYSNVQPFMRPTCSGIQKLQGMAFMKMEQYRPFDAIISKKYHGEEAMKRAKHMSLRHSVESGGFINDYDPVSYLINDALNGRQNCEKRLVMAETYK